MNEEQIRKIYDGTGWNATDTAKQLKELCRNGYEESFDGSLWVFYFPQLVVVLTCAECVIKHTVE